MSIVSSSGARSGHAGKGVATDRRLLDRKYSILLLAELARRRGAKVVTLANALGASRAAIRRALAELVKLGWVIHNPGYGHPLRPEYLLHPEAEALARSCRDLAGALSGPLGRRVLTTKWPLPILDALGSAGPSRFSAIAGRFPEITDRALSLALQDLEAAGLVERELVDGRPPRAVYAVTARGRTVREHLAKARG